jgi:iron complex outermembrane receptor protein
MVMFHFYRRIFLLIIANMYRPLMSTAFKTYFFLWLVPLFFQHVVLAQQGKDSVHVIKDSVYTIEEVMVEGYPDKIPLLKSPVSAGVLDKKQLSNQAGVSLVPALNTLAGVRMEERSPGSYRLSVRGSLLRSPFGIRNVKIYIDEFPLTDAGGNSYLNLMDVGSIKRVELLKGPQGSLFGANTGGVVRIQPFEKNKTDGWHGNASLIGGTYNLFHQKLDLQHQSRKHTWGIYEAYQYSSGYRKQSAMERKYLQLTDVYDYSRKGKLKAFAFLSDLRYQTPGALTLSEYQQDPSAVRPKSGKSASAEQQKAEVFNTTLYGGLSNEFKLLKNLRHVISVFATHTDFKNPSISNYEIRNETTFGTRTYLELSGDKEARFSQWKWNGGVEWQKTNSSIKDYGNRSGVQDTAQSLDEVDARQYFLFTQFSATLGKLHMELGLSFNHYRYQYRSIMTSPLPSFTVHPFDAQWMPRLALSYEIIKSIYWRGSASRGYSPPTIAEVRPSDNVVHTSLQPESGWNIETGLRYQDSRIKADAVVFYYNLQNAIVSRVNANGTQYFVNAGGTRQPGFEWQFSAELIKPREKGIFRTIELGNSVTYYQFSFTNYTSGSTDYSGHHLTGVPEKVIVTSLNATFAKGFFIYGQYNYTSSVPLNDANTAYATDYHLIQLKGGWNYTFKERYGLQLFAGVDNLLNTTYSLGNDLNAAGGRYYNAAPLRNFYVGGGFSF